MLAESAGSRYPPRRRSVARCCGGSSAKKAVCEALGLGSGEAPGKRFRLRQRKGGLRMKDYGNGASTGLDQTAAGKIFTGACREDLAMTAETARCCAAWRRRWPTIAASERMAETRRLWAKINRLEKTRPAVFCDPENGWNEIITEAQMQCRGKLARRWEMDLRKEIFWGEVMGDDKPVEPYFDVPYTVSPDDWGLQADFEKSEPAGLLRLAGRDQRLRHGPEEAALAAVRDRSGNHPRLPGDRPRGLRRSADGPAQGHLVVVAGADLAGGHVSRPAEHALRFHRESRRVEGVARRSSRAAISTSSTTWRPRGC